MPNQLKARVSHMDGAHAGIEDAGSAELAIKWHKLDFGLLSSPLGPPLPWHGPCGPSSMRKMEETKIELPLTGPFGPLRKNVL